MKLVYQTDDGMSFKNFDAAQSHELEIVDNALGAVIDTGLVKSDNPIKHKENVHAFITENRILLAGLLRQYDKIHSLSDPLDADTGNDIQDNVDSLNDPQD